MTATILSLPVGPHAALLAVRARLVGRVAPEVLAEAQARAERLAAHGIRPAAIIRQVVAWGLARG